MIDLDLRPGGVNIVRELGWLYSSRHGWIPIVDEPLDRSAYAWVALCDLVIPGAAEMAAADDFLSFPKRTCEGAGGNGPTGRPAGSRDWSSETGNSAARVQACAAPFPLANPARGPGE